MKIQDLHIFLGSLLGFFILVYLAEGADESQNLVTFTRLGVVIEIRNDPTKLIEARVKSGTDSVPVIVQTIDEERLFLNLYGNATHSIIFALLCWTLTDIIYPHSNRAHITSARLS